MVRAAAGAGGTLRPDLAAFNEFNLEVDRRGYVGTQVLRGINVSLQADNPGKIPVDQLLRVVDDLANGGNYNNLATKFERWAYATTEHGLQSFISHREAKRYEHVIGGAERIHTARVTGAIALNMEHRIAKTVFNTTEWAGADLTTAVATAWDESASKPIDDVEGGIKKVHDKTGLWCNAVLLSRVLFRVLRNNQQIIDRITSNGAGDAAKAGDITPAMIAACFDVKYCIVAGGAKNIADEGQDKVIRSIWDSTMCMPLVVAESEDIVEPCIGRTFNWTEDGSDIGGTIETWDAPNGRGRYVHCRNDVDEVIMYKQAGHLLTGCN